MRAIQVPNSKVSKFLQAANELGLTVTHYRFTSIKGVSLYKVQQPYSQHQLFMLGVRFALLWL